MATSITTTARNSYQFQVDYIQGFQPEEADLAQLLMKAMNQTMSLGFESRLANIPG
jgi:hypothetical protein